MPKQLKKVKKYREKVPLFSKKILKRNFLKYLKLKSNLTQEDI